MVVAMATAMATDWPDGVVWLLDVNNIRGNTICPFGDAVGMSIGAYLRQFPEEFIAHVEQGRCTYPAW